MASTANPGLVPFKTVMSRTKLRAHFKDLLRVLEASQPVASAEVKAVAASIIKAQEKPALASALRGLAVIELGLSPLGFKPSKKIDRKAVADVCAERDRLVAHMLLDVAAEWTVARRGKRTVIA